MPEFGIFGLAGGETSMGKEARRAIVLDDEVQKKYEEYVAALTTMRYGPEGPPEDTTFAEIEEFVDFMRIRLTMPERQAVLVYTL